MLYVSQPQDVEFTGDARRANSDNGVLGILALDRGRPFHSSGVPLSSWEFSKPRLIRQGRYCVVRDSHMIILVLNCGSSSVKYKLFDLDSGAETVLASGIVEEVGLGSPSLTHRRPGQEKVVRTGLQVKDHRDAIQMVLRVLWSRPWAL